MKYMKPMEVVLTALDAYPDAVSVGISSDMFDVLKLGDPLGAVYFTEDSVKVVNPRTGVLVEVVALP